tara:strand:+ start:1188 stop:1499 length:312 start_codon:yes stop_codon:yes gene_type:complete
MILEPTIIQKLIEDDCHNLWEKYNKKRLYLDFAKIVNLQINRYNTGNISSAYLEGEKISNSKASKYIQGKAFIDLTSNKLQCQYMNSEIVELLENALSEKLAE